MNIGDRVCTFVLDADEHVEIKFGRVVSFGGRMISVLVGQDICFWPRDECYLTVAKATEAAEKIRSKTQAEPTPEDLRELDSTP